MGLYDYFFGDDQKKTEDNPYGDSDSFVIDDVLNSEDSTPEQRSLAGQVQSQRNKAINAGLDPGDATPREGFFGSLLDTLDAPRQGVTGILDAALRGDIGSPEVGTGYLRGQEENTSVRDILRREGVTNPVVRGVAGLAGDVLLDPLTYLSLGTSTAATAGGRALTEGGALLKGTLEKNLLEGGTTDLLTHGGIVDDTFKAVDRYQDAWKNLKKAEDPSDIAIQQARMDDAATQFSPYVSENDVLGKDIFEKKGLNIGAEIPFLGHFTGAAPIASEEILKDVGPIGQAMRAFSKAYKPGKIGLGKITFSDDTLDAINNVRAYANTQIQDFGKSLAQLPGGETIVNSAKGLRNAYESLSNSILRTFNQKALIGKDAHNAQVDYYNAAAAAKQAAHERAFQVVGDQLLQDPDTQKEVILALDSGAQLGLQGALQDEKGSGDLLKTINQLRTSDEVPDSALSALREQLAKYGAEDKFNSHITNLLADPSVDPKVKDGLQRVVGAMDSLSQDEAARGLGYSRLENYITHKYVNKNNLNVNNRIGLRVAQDNFSKARTYATLSDAYKDSGLIADMNLPSLLEGRFSKSFTLQQQANYARRMQIENGLPEQQVINLYQEALSEPNGPAAMALKKYRIKLSPPPVEADAIKEATLNAYKQDIYKGIGSGSPTVDHAVGERLADTAEKMNQQLWAGGMRPLDSLTPQQILGEIGESVTNPVTQEKFWLPKPQADAYRETLASRDILKKAASGNRFTKASLGLLDYASGQFKKFNTLPWPGYWVQNAIGDRFNQAMAGAAALDPGIFARTHSVLAGKSAIVSPNGLRLDKEALQKVIKDMGMSYTVNDHLGTIESFSNMNVDKYLASKENFAQNLIGTLSGKNKLNNASAALGKTQETFQKAFDGFARVSHMVHRFEKGDTIPDAVRAANELYYNYRDMSPVESSLFRRFYMFYGYMSKATKQSINSLMRSPGDLTHQLSGARSLAELFSDPNAAPDADAHDMKILQSSLNRDQLSFRVGTSPEGKPIIGQGFAAPLNSTIGAFNFGMPRNFSIGELMDTAVDSGRRVIQKQFAAANPAINAVSQLVSGKNLYFDKPLNAEFLRKLPSLNEAARNIAPYAYDNLPIDLDAATKYFLKAVPDGKGRLIANPARMWILTNLVPGLSRAASTAGVIGNAEIPTPAKFLRALGGVRLDDSDISRSTLYDEKNALDQFLTDNSANQRIKNKENEEGSY